MRTMTGTRLPPLPAVIRKRKQSKPKRNAPAAAAAIGAAAPATAGAVAGPSGAQAGGGDGQRPAKRQRQQQGQQGSPAKRQRRAKALPVVGDTVEISWETNGKLKPFCGIVLATRQAGQQGSEYEVAYIDGEVHWHNLASETWRVLPPQQPKSQKARASLAAIRQTHNLPLPPGPEQRASAAQQGSPGRKAAGDGSARKQRGGGAALPPAVPPPAAQPPATPAAAAAPQARAPSSRVARALPAAASLLPVPSRGAVAQLAAQAEQAAQRAMDEAVQAFTSATAADGDSMLMPFRRLLRAQPDCQPLRAIVHGWASFTPAQRQALFDAAVIVAGRGLWSALEDQLAEELAGLGLPAA